MYENLTITIEYCLPIIVILLCFIAAVLAWIAYKLDNVEDRLIEIRSKLSGIKNNEDSSAEKKRDS